MQTTNTENKYIIFTDGSSRGNPGPGGFSAIIIFGDKIVEIGGRDSHTTNNRMEMVAAIEALNKLDRMIIDNAKNSSSKNIFADIVLDINTDSSYLINGITKWVFGWQKNNWITSQKKDVENKDLWERLVEAVKGKKISWNYVGGHVGVAGNERCDIIATSFADNKAESLYSGPFSDYPIKNIMDVSQNLDSAITKKSSSERAKTKAYSYISSINGSVKIHKTWPECESRVKGVKGARFKKSIDAEDEAKIIIDFRKVQ